MKIAILWNHPSRLLDCSFRFEQYLKGFRDLGHEPFLVCAPSSAEGGFPDEEIHVADGPGAFRDAGFWRALGADVVVVTTWLRMSDVLAAIRAAGVRTVAITDSDGQVGFHVYPRIALERLLVYHRAPLDRLRCLKQWLGRYLRERRQGVPSEDREALASARESDVLSFCHTGGREKFRGVVERWGAPELMAKAVVVPFTNGASFLSCPVEAEKAERLVAVGRWDDPQKNAPLLAAALDRVLTARPTVEAVIFGGGGAKVFAPLTRHPSFALRGVQRQEVVARTLAASRVWVGCSRWETGPMAATEALALGATIVGTPIPSYESYSEASPGESGPFGRVSRRTTPSSLADAILAELATWDAGRRDGLAIAAHWRTLLDPAELCRLLLAPLATL